MNIAEHDLQGRARRRVKIRSGFYLHVLVYGLVNLGLTAINWVVGGRPWHWWPLAGWGLGLAIHGIVAFAGLRGDGWHERMLDRELQRLRREQGPEADSLGKGCP